LILFQRHRWHRLQSFIAVALIVGLPPIGLEVARHSLVINRPVRSDVILVPSGDFSVRSNRALELAKDGFGDRIVIDEGADVLTFGRTLAERRIEQTSGWPFVVTVCPVTKESTSGESRQCGSYLQELGARRVLIVTSDFHTRRALASFKKTNPSISFSVASVPTGYSAAPWWSLGTAVRTIREMGGLLWLKIR